MATLKMKMIDEENDRSRNMPHLFTHRCDVENYNKNVFQHLCDSKKTVVEAIDSISGDLPCSLQKSTTENSYRCYKNKGIEQIPVCR